MRRSLLRKPFRARENRWIQRLILNAAGFVCVGLGAVGVILPVLPTTPLVLLAALCFSVGNPRLFEWLCKNPVFGPYIENYRTRQGIRRRLKVFSIAFLWAGLILSVLVARITWLYPALGIVGAGVTLHLLLIKTKKE